MLRHPTLEQLHALGLHGMAKAFAELADADGPKDLVHADWLSLLLDKEISWRKDKRLAARLSAAKLRHQASVEDVDYRAARGLDRALFQRLSEGDWIDAHDNLVLVGPAGVGKSWLACAIGHRACRDNRAVLYHRWPKLCGDPAFARGDGRHSRLIKALGRADLLILDDFGLEPLDASARHDLLEILEERYGRRSTIVTSQLPLSAWREVIGDPTYADAILDRLAHNAHRIELTGESLRRTRGKQNETGNFPGVGYELLALAGPSQPSLVEEAAVAATAAIEWKITVEGTDVFGEVRRHEIRIDKTWDRLLDGEIGLSVEDGKKIMAALQTAIVSQEADTYTLFRRICPDCGALRPVKDYTTRRIRTVFGTVEVRNPRWMLCRNCHPSFALAFAPLCEICPDRATPELTELTARLGSMMPYRQAASIMAEFLPIEPTETHATVRKRAIRAGERLDRQAAEEERSASSQVKDRRQLELELPGDRRREFVVSVDTAHVRSADPKSARNFELVVARCGRGGRGEPGGRYFVTASTDQRALRDRALHALGQEGYCGFGEVAVISDGAEILKRLPRAMPRPTAHIIDWFHIAMKIQPMHQIADHMARFRRDEPETSPSIVRRIRAVKWRLWHGRVDRAIRDLQELLDGLKPVDEIEDVSISRLRSLGAQLLTYIESNRSGIINYGKRYRAGLRVASTLAESAVNSIVGKRMAKSQQMRWSLRGAHMLMQVRTADINGELRNRMRAEFRKPDPSVPWMFRPKPPLLRAA